MVHLDYVSFVSQCSASFVRHLYFSVYYILSCTVVLVLGCDWPCLAVVKHLNKCIELNYYYYYYYYYCYYYYY
jgi:hypothetical protein